MTNKCEAELKIINKKGLHARAAAAFVKTAEKFNAEVSVSKSGQTVGGRSIMGLMMLVASKGSRIVVKATGDEAVQALQAISELVNDKFGEE